MNKYEYKVEIAAGNYGEIESDLDALGEEGWELINVFPLPPRNDKREMWFRRLKFDPIV